jgi:TatD DNase family protein
VLDRLETFENIGVPVLHWYSGSQSELNRAVGLGCWFSVGPAMLSGEKGRALAARVPQDRLLTETDGPFGSVKGKALFPWDSNQAVRGIASIWGVEEKDVEYRLRDNLRRLTSLL